MGLIMTGSLFVFITKLHTRSIADSCYVQNILLKNEGPQYLGVGFFRKFVGFEIDITGEK